MLDNKINTSSVEKIEFKTHTVFYKKIGRYFAGYVTVNDHIYTEMVLSSRCYVGNDSIQNANLNMLAEVFAEQFHVYPNPEYVFKNTPIENERYLIYRFVKSIFLGDERNLYLFSDDNEYKAFCSSNDFEHTQQEWFKRFYVALPFDNALNYVLQKSLEYQELYFPDNSKFSRTMPSLHEPKFRSVISDFKSDFNEIYDILKRNNISRLYHFTDYKNISSIISRGAIYSQKEIQDRCITTSYASSADSRSADKARGTDNFVRLSFVRNHPMMYTAVRSGRITRPVVLEINPFMALMPGVLFSNMNALKRGASIGASAYYLKNVCFEVFNKGSYLYLSDVDKNYRNYLF